MVEASRFGVAEFRGLPWSIAICKECVWTCVLLFPSHLRSTRTISETDVPDKSWSRWLSHPNHLALDLVHLLGAVQ